MKAWRPTLQRERAEHSAERAGEAADEEQRRGNQAQNELLAARGPGSEPLSYLTLAENEGYGTLSGAGGLEAELLKGLVVPHPSFQTLDRKVSEASLEERQAAFRSQTLHQAIGASALSRPEQLALSTALAEGSLQWGMPRVGPPGWVSDFYRFFVLEDAKGPPPDMQTMNCFELVLYSAWQIGQIPTEWIVELGNNSEGGPSTISYAELGWSSTMPTLDPADHRLPATGDLIFVTAPGAGEPWHVMLSLGGEEAMSLWKRPERDTPVRRLQLSEYAGQTLQFGAPPWNT